MAKVRANRSKKARRPSRTAREPVVVPAQIIEYFLLGQTRRGEIERYTQDGGIVLDVWLEFAKNLREAQRILLAPHPSVSAIHLGAAIHHALAEYRKHLPHTSARYPKDRKATNVSPLESYVAVTVYLDELLRVVLPLTSWWLERSLAALSLKVARHSDVRQMLTRAIEIRLRRGDAADLSKMRYDVSRRPDEAVQRGSHGAPGYPPWRVIDAAPIAALLGVFMLAESDPKFLKSVPPLLSRGTDAERNRSADEFEDWLGVNADRIADAAVRELEAPLHPDVLRHARMLAFPDEPPERTQFRNLVFIQRVFLNREATLAANGVTTIKADAATRLFEISCTNITWGIIDAGIATGHPAFVDRSAPSPPNGGARPSRIKKTVDFTMIQQLRNFDLIRFPEGSPQRRQELKRIADQLAHLPGRKHHPDFQRTAIRNLELIAQQFARDMQPDWSLLEPLITIPGHDDDGFGLSSDHGTHVAGVLGADWRRVRPAGRKRGRNTQPTPEQPEEIILQGVCPDINFYDLRVIAASAQSTEFAIVAAIEYVQFVNQRAGRNGPIVHGVNISLSIPHKVRSYGCGATPVCVACDRLSASGVVVVTAAGNRGWNEQEIGFGNFVFCSITDPGNADAAITVGATHGDKPYTYGVSYFSSRGPTGDGRVKPDIVAPGEHVRGPIRGNADAELDGTSQAAPFVSGAAAMLLARNAELIGNAARIKEILLQTASDLKREKYFQGHGLLDVLRALQSV